MYIKKSDCLFLYPFSFSLPWGRQPGDGGGDKNYVMGEGKKVGQTSFE
jgi:hypothetical protein